jgi:hypothetical protein
MNITRWMMVAALGLLGSTWARADIPTGQTFTITLLDWDPNQTFNFVPTTGLDTADFTNPDDYCPGADFCFDPDVYLEKGGDAPPESGEFSFSTGPSGTAILSYTNTGPDISELLLQLTSNDGQLDPTQDFEVFTCNGGNAFTNCGFYNDGFEVGLWDTPEPSLWIVLVIAFAALIVVRVRTAKPTS